MEVTVLSKPNNMMANVAARTCTDTVDKMPFVSFEDEQEDTNRIINMLIKRGHESVLEHLNYTFDIQGISRAY